MIPRTERSHKTHILTKPVQILSSTSLKFERLAASLNKKGTKEKLANEIRVSGRREKSVVDSFEMSTDVAISNSITKFNRS